MKGGRKEIGRLDWRKEGEKGKKAVRKKGRCELR